MIRTWWFLPLGGCLLGWEPEPERGADKQPDADADTDGDSDSDADGDSDSDSDADTEPSCTPPEGMDFCARFDQRSVTIDPSSPPVFSSDEGISDLYVYEGEALLWHAWASDNENSLLSYTYGQTPPGTLEGGPAVPLSVGGVYEVKFDALCVDDTCEPAVSSVYETFSLQ
jgi:hypothetical protein